MSCVVVEAAQRAAAQSLARTPELLDVLDEAGVVDAGGQAYVLLLDVVSELLGGDPAEPLGDVRAVSFRRTDRRGPARWTRNVRGDVRRCAVPTRRR